MRLLFATSLAAALATAALADKSDRYNDLRLDTGTSQASAEVPAATPVALSTKNDEGTASSYPYANPYGVGPYNDSR